VSALYSEQAKILEQQGRYKEAEKLYITISDPHQAIQMYKRIKNYDNMIRLIQEFHSDMVNDTYVHLAKELEQANNFKQAESYYIKGNDWKAAINMYRKMDNWEESYKIAKNYGGPVPTKQVAYMWAKSLGGDSAVKLLTKLGLLEQCIDFAIENGLDFRHLKLISYYAYLILKNSVIVHLTLLSSCARRHIKTRCLR
jgi:intraflagellar transport protein 172